MTSYVGMLGVEDLPLLDGSKEKKTFTEGVNE